MSGLVANNKASSKITLRCVILSLVLIFVNIYWVAVMHNVWNMVHATTVSLFINVTFTLLILILFNLLLKRFLPRRALTEAELLVVYVMLSIATALNGHDTMQVLVPVLAYPFWFATPENEWAELFHRYIPTWSTVRDKKVLRAYYEGNSTLYTVEHIRAWLVPVVAWSAFIVVLVFIMLCINVIMRKQWTEREKLAYPVIQMPLEITKGGGALEFFRNRAFLAGFAIAAGIDLLNGLHFLYSTIPELRVKPHYLGHLFVSKPWNAIGSFQISFYPFIIGLIFFIPLELSFSGWFFYLLRKLQLIFGGAIGWTSLPRFPYTNEQAFGAYLGLSIIAIWKARRYLGRIIKRAFTRDSGAIDDSNEPMRYRSAIWGIIAGITFLILFCLKAGMSLWVIICFFAIYFSLSMGITRMRAELGPPSHELFRASPGKMIISAVGSSRLSPYDLTMLSFFFWFTRVYRSHPMPHQLEGFKIAQRARIDNRKLMLCIMLATVFGAVISFAALLDTFYRYGDSERIYALTSGMGKYTFDRLQRYLSYPTGTEHPAVVFMGLGMAFTIFLAAMRARFIFWPFHAVGYALSGSFTMDVIWFCFFLSWLAKGLILRYSGLAGYRRAVPFFIGLVLGEYVVGCFWGITAVVTRVKLYSIWYF